MISGRRRGFDFGLAADGLWVMVAMPVITLGGRFLLLHVVFPYVNKYLILPILQTLLNFTNLNPEFLIIDPPPPPRPNFLYSLTFSFVMH